MIDGELKKQIKAEVGLTGDYGNDLDVEDVFRIIDEAKENFPIKVYDGTAIIDTRKQQIEKKMSEVITWFIEYFGDIT